jgi:hypothetical protein
MRGGNYAGQEKRNQNKKNCCREKIREDQHCKKDLCVGQD